MIFKQITVGELNTNCFIARSAGSREAVIIDPGAEPEDILFEVITCGGLDLQVIHTPGHTPGSVCLRTAGAVFLGDTLFAEGIGRTDFPYSSPEESRRSILERILTLPDDLLALAGHGFISTVGEIKQDNIYLRELVE